MISADVPKIRKAVLASRSLRPSDRLVLLVAAELRDLDPGRIADGAGVAVDLVEQALARLEAAGIVERAGRDRRIVPAWYAARQPGLELLGAGREADDRKIAQVWYSHWQARHPRSVAAIPKDCLNLAMHAIKILRAEHGSHVREIEREGCAVVDWLHDAPDAAFWQREGRLGFQNAFKVEGWTDKLTRARLWADGGRHAAEEPVKRERTEDRQAAERSWVFIDRWIREGESSIPDAAREKMGPAKVARLEAAIEAVGGWREIGRLSSREEAEARRAFIAAFCDFDPKVDGKGCAQRARG